MNLPKHYSLVHEKSDHFLIHDARDKRAFQVAKKPLHPANQLKIMRLPKFSDGGEIKKMSDGTQPSDLPKGMTQEDADKMKAVADTVRAVPGAIRGLWHDSSNDQPDVPPETPPQPQLQEGPMSQMTPDQAATPPQQQVQAQPQGQDAGQPPGMPNSTQGYPTLGEFNNLENQGAKAINQQTQGQIGQNFEQAKAMRDSQALEQEYMAHSQRVLEGYQQQNDRLMNDVASGKVDPDKYWDDHSKMGAAFAVLLSGIGSGIQHSTQNLAMDAIQKGIDRSMEAQKAELGKKENLLSNNLKVQGNLQQAQEATMLQMRAMAQGKLAKIAMETGDPILQAQAQQRIVQMKMSDMPIKQQLAQYQTQMHMRDMLSKMDTSHMDPAQIVNYLPNITPEAKTQILKEIDTAQNVHNNAGRMAEAQRNAANFHVANIMPGKNNVYQDQLHTLLGPTFNDLHESLREASMNNVFNGVTPKFGDSVVSDPEEKQKTLLNYMRSKEAAPTAKSYGLDLSKFESTRFPKEAFQVKDSREGQMGTLNGQRVMMKNGQVVPVGR
jgi:hypothetical protein